MMYAKVREDSRWYRVIDVIDDGPRKQNIYLLDIKGRVQQEDIEKLEFD